MQFEKLDFQPAGKKGDLIKRLEEAKDVDMHLISLASSEDIVENVKAFVCTICKLTGDATVITEAKQNVINEVNAGLTTEAVSGHCGWKPKRE